MVISFLTRGLNISSGTRRYSSVNGAGKRAPVCKRMKVNYLISPHTKVNPVVSQTWMLNQILPNT